MKNTTLNNSGIIVEDERIWDLDRIVQEVKQTEEWEAVDDLKRTTHDSKYREKLLREFGI